MRNIRTDMALELREMRGTAEIPGVEDLSHERNGVRTNTVRILDERGVEAIGRPVGVYVTLTPPKGFARDGASFEAAATELAACLKALLPQGGGTALVAGLGNCAITPDELGPRALRRTLVTRHLVDRVPEHFGGFRRVAAVETGVLGTTGVESAELIDAVKKELSPDVIIVIDALASRRTERLCATVQLTDTGIVPGSGVGNARSEISAATLGVPVIALGVPTVVDAATLAADLMEAGGLDAPPENAFRGKGGEMIVTPRDIDERITDMARLLGAGINLALHDGLTLADADALTS